MLSTTGRGVYDDAATLPCVATSRLAPNSSTNHRDEEIAANFVRHFTSHAP
jgi:hypothetical protein